MIIRTKYNSKKCEFNGHVFDSKDEMLYYQYLLSIQAKRPKIIIELQPKFELIPNYIYRDKKRRGITYTADFKATVEDGTFVIIDIKGMETQQSVMRRKLFEYKYPEIKLMWVSRNLKYGTNGWIGYDELKQIRSKNKKEKVHDHHR